MNIRDFVKDSLQRFANNCKAVFITGEHEHVTVTVRGAQWNGDADESADVAGGKVYVESYHPGLGKVNKTVSYDIPASGVVEFDILKGTHYSVYSTVSGLGASMRCVFVADRANRNIPLWNVSLGVWKAITEFCTEDDENYRGYPVFIPHGDDEPSGYNNWDLQGDEYIDDNSERCILVSTADCSFVLKPNSKSSESLVWSKESLGREVPYLESYRYTNSSDDAAQAAVGRDYSGNLNTDKIVNALADAPAAYFAIQNNANYYFQSYLPSVGELTAISLNKDAINAILSDWGDSDIPNVDTDTYWTSCQYSANRSWSWSYNRTRWNRSTKTDAFSCRSVSAFTYIYD